ncbi:MAG: hypothetical protein K2P81_01140 [Bacteriovoracaceae bacterium]|nr:hypothetical protein [Bacteriovoracaceae bacterium]
MPNIPEPIRLIGNPEENFYILGKKHQSAFFALSKKLNGDQSVKEQILEFANRLRKTEQVTLPDNSWGQWIKAYCDGLEVSSTRYLKFLEQIEDHALKGSLPGCTSVFHWDPETQLPQHLRLLDWPLAHTTEDMQELILLKLPNNTSLFFVCLPGLVFLPLTAMSSNGMTIALHAKYRALKPDDSRPISEAVIEGLLHSKNLIELRRNLKTFKSQRLWGLHCLDASGNVLVMDIGGPQVDVFTADLKETPLMVFNNIPLAQNKERDPAEPSSFAQFCQERRQWCFERLKSDSKDHPLLRLTRAHKLQHSKAPAVTSSTLQALCLTPSTRSFEMIAGLPPMWNQGSLIRWQNIFQTEMRTHDLIPQNYPAEEKKLWKMFHCYSLAQKHMDLGELTAAFHYIQMGLGQAHGEAFKLGSWVWAFWQWKYLSNKRDRLMLYHQSQRLLNQESSHYKAFILFLRFLLELDLDLVATVTPLDLPENLRRWSEELLMKPTSTKAQLINKIEARLDLQDLLLPWTNEGSLS